MKPPPPAPVARVIVVGNEKGGAGKSTVASLIATAMLYQGARVAVIDLDLRQQSVTHFFANRRRWLPAAGVKAPSPLEYRLAEDTVDLAEADPMHIVDLFEEAVGLAMSSSDLVVIDTPGGDTAVSRSAHLQADVVVTPMNDSFVDFDVLGVVDPVSLRMIRPSIYSRTIANSRRVRAGLGRELDWVVLRNRMAGVDARNRTRLTATLEALSAEVGFRIGPSIKDRVAFREMFPFGLTIADMTPTVQPPNVASPRAAAREELRLLLDSLGLTGKSAETACISEAASG